MAEIENMILSVTNEEVKQLQNELIALYHREVFEKKIYYEQSMKLEGDIMEIVKDLEQQEEMHEHVLSMLLIKSGIKAVEGNTKIPRSKISDPLSKTIGFDIEQENISIKIYESTIAKAGINLAKVLKFIMEQEFTHVKILQKFLDENK